MSIYYKLNLGGQCTRITSLFKNLFNFEITESYHISFLAVSKAFRGQGLGRKLLDHAEEQGKLEGYETISLYTASCQTSAIKLYHKFGMMITKVITVSERIHFPCFLYFEKNKTLMTQHDYFDTEAYPGSYICENGQVEHINGLYGSKVVLKNKSLVQGDIHFTEHTGVVCVDDSSELKGQVVNGKLVRGSCKRYEG